MRSAISDSNPFANQSVVETRCESSSANSPASRTLEKTKYKASPQVLQFIWACDVDDKSWPTSPQKWRTKRGTCNSESLLKPLASAKSMLTISGENSERLLGAGLGGGGATGSEVSSGQSRRRISARSTISTRLPELLH